MVKLEARPDGSVVTLALKGRLCAEDYRQFTPELDRLVAQHGKLRLLLDMSDLDSVEPQAILRDALFDVRHYNAFERIAMAGDERWHEWLREASPPFTGAELRYFDRGQLQAARQWLEES